MRGAGYRLSGARPALCTLLAIAAANATAAFAADPPLTASAQSSVERLTVGESAAVSVDVVIADGWHINGTAVQEGLEFLIPTSMTFELPDGVRATDVRFPEPVVRKLELAGAREMRVYEGAVRIDARLLYDRASGAAGSPVAVLRYQACTQTLCARPTSVRITVPIEIAGAQGRVADGRDGSGRAPAPGMAKWAWAVLLLAAAIAVWVGRGRFAGKAGSFLTREWSCIVAGMPFYFVQASLPGSLAHSSMSPVVLTRAAVSPALIGRTHAGNFAAAARMAAATAALVVMAAVAGGPARAASLPFEPFTAQAYDRARASKMPFVVEFTADWCLPCREMAERTFTDPDVLRAGKNMTFLSLDMTTSDRRKELILESFGVPGAPTTVFFGADGKEITRRVGFVGPDEFARLLEDARNSSKDADAPAPSGVRGI